MRNVLLVAALFAAFSLPALAQNPPPNPASPATPVAQPTTLDDFARSRIDTMLREGHAEAGWFSASFLAKVPIDKVNAILGPLQSSLGVYKSIDGAQGDYTAHFANGTDEILVHLDADDKIDGLLLRPPKMTTASLDGSLRAISALATPTGTVSYVIEEGRSQVAALDSSRPLAVGSAFKLAVLNALRDEIARGAHRWNDVIALPGRLRSLPSGVLQRWPDATPITLATYAAEMISISDNTAADELIRVDGAKALARYAKGNAPFLTTREMFVLKSTPGAAQRAAYVAARTPAERARVLRAIDAMPLPSIPELASLPILNVEWHYSVRDLCDLMGRVADLPLMSINPGVADATMFRHVAYKGGSDTGIINLTTEVTTKRGATLCFSATLNDSAKAVDETAFESAYQLVLSALANR